MITISKTTLSEFAETIKNEVITRLPKCEVCIKEVIKNNDTKKLGLVIREEGSSIAPTLYLNEIYEKYCEGSIRFDVAVDNIIRQFHRCCESESSKLNLPDFTDFDAVKDRICFRVVNRAANTELFQDKPHRPFLDLAFYYCINLGEDDEQSATVPITFDMMRLWDVDESTLYYLSQDNTRRISDYSIRNIISVLTGILPDEELPEPEDETPSMYVVTNRQNSFGAAAILDQSLCYSFAEQCGKNYFILPSSVHELLFVPDNGELKVDELEAMVREINHTQVAAEERLSDSVYLYMKDTGHILKLS